MAPAQDHRCVAWGHRDQNVPVELLSNPTGKLTTRCLWHRIAASINTAWYTWARDGSTKSVSDVQKKVETTMHGYLDRWKVQYGSTNALSAEREMEISEMIADSGPTSDQKHRNAAARRAQSNSNETRLAGRSLNRKKSSKKRKGSRKRNILEPRSADFSHPDFTVWSGSDHEEGLDPFATQQHQNRIACKARKCGSKYPAIEYQDPANAELPFIHCLRCRATDHIQRIMQSEAVDLDDIYEDKRDGKQWPVHDSLRDRLLDEFRHWYKAWATIMRAAGFVGIEPRRPSYERFVRKYVGDYWLQTPSRDISKSPAVESDETTSLSGLDTHGRATGTSTRPAQGRRLMSRPFKATNTTRQKGRNRAATEGHAIPPHIARVQKKIVRLPARDRAGRFLKKKARSTNHRLITAKRDADEPHQSVFSREPGNVVNNASESDQRGLSREPEDTLLDATEPYQRGPLRETGYTVEGIAASRSREDSVEAYPSIECESEHVPAEVNDPNNTTNCIAATPNRLGSVAACPHVEAETMHLQIEVPSRYYAQSKRDEVMHDTFIDAGRRSDNSREHSVSGWATTDFEESSSDAEPMACDEASSEDMQDGNSTDAHGSSRNTASHRSTTLDRSSLYSVSPANPDSGFAGTELPDVETMGDQPAIAEPADDQPIRVTPARAGLTQTWLASAEPINGDDPTIYYPNVADRHTGPMSTMQGSAPSTLEAMSVDPMNIDAGHNEPLSVEGAAIGPANARESSEKPTDIDLMETHNSNDEFANVRYTSDDPAKLLEAASTYDTLLVTPNHKPASRHSDDLSTIAANAREMSIPSSDNADRGLTQSAPLNVRISHGAGIDHDRITSPQQVGSLEHHEISTRHHNQLNGNVLDTTRGTDTLVNAETFRELLGAIKKLTAAVGAVKANEVAEMMNIFEAQDENTFREAAVLMNGMAHMAQLRGGKA